MMHYLPIKFHQISSAVKEICLQEIEELKWMNREFLIYPKLYFIVKKEKKHELRWSDKQTYKTKQCAPPPSIDVMDNMTLTQIFYIYFGNGL